MKHLTLLVVLTPLMLAVAVNLSAQTSNSGSMNGNVVDASGQVVPGANITITNEETGEKREAVSNEVGDYTFQGLQQGPYTVRAEMQGFKPFEIKNNIVQANNRLTVRPLRLEVGALTETVSVTAVGETVATTVTSHQAILDTKQVENLSIRGRDPMSLLKVLPGVGSLANDQETFGGSFSTPVPNIQGGRGQTIYVDGINGGDGGGGGNFSGAVNMDAIEEVNVQMSAYTAEYGMKGGAQVNLITKHGGSEYHGTGYWYLRHESLNATNFFNNKAGIPKPVYRYSTQGGTVGGPIPKVPKINSDGNKLFFFYSIDDTQLKDANILRRYTVPTAAERQGDFSNTRQTNGTLIVVRDPLTGQPFPDNKIPLDRMDARSMALINLIPLPNANGSGYNFVYQEPSIPHPRRQHLIRLDYRPTSSQTISGKYSSWYTKSVGYNVAGASSRWGLVRQRYDFTVDQAKLDYTRVINSSTILEVNAGEFYSTELGPPEGEKALAGIQRKTYPALANLPQFAPIWNPLGLIPTAQFGTGGRNNDAGLQNNSDLIPNVTYDGRWPITGADTAFNISASMTHTRGTHTYKAGLMREHEIFEQARSGIFSGEFSFANDGADPLNTGFAYANAFIGHVTSYTESMGKPPDDRVQNTWAWFAQDTWKMNRHLTVDYGVRMYKWRPPISQVGEASGFSFDRFDPTWGGKPPVLFTPILVNGARRAQNPLTGEILPVTYVGLMVPGTGYSCEVITPGNPCKINGMVTQEDSTYSNAGVGFINKVPIQFDPRVGLAWSPNAKTVVRVAGGSFHDGTGGPTLQQGAGNAMWRYERVVRYTDMSSYLTGTSASAPGSVNGAILDDTKRPNNRRWTAAIQRDLGKHTVLDVAYVGDNTRYLGREFNFNEVPAGARFLAKNRDLTQPDSATVGLDPTKPNPGALPDVFLRPIIGFGDITVIKSDGTSNYNSVQTQLSRRFTGGIEVAGSYTWAKGHTNIACCNNDNSKPDVGNLQNLGSGQYQGNPVSPSNSNFLRPLQQHVFVMSYTLEVPNGSKLLGDKSKWVVDNWRISGISTLATGLPRAVTFTTTDNFDFTGGGDRCSNSVGPYPVVKGNADVSNATFDRWFDTTMFARPTGRGDVGTCDNFTFTGPGFNNHDVTIFKEFPVKQGQALQFRWEIYNLFNSVQGWEVNSAAQFDAAGNQTNVNFGKVTSARNERRMQMGLRYTW